jgi:hypothetical protein
MMAYWTHTKNPIGAFTEKEVGNVFEYSNNDDALNNVNEDFLHKIWVGDGYRYGTVMKTRVVICVDEDEYGLPVTEKWMIKNHREYAV